MGLTALVAEINAKLVSINAYAELVEGEAQDAEHTKAPRMILVRDSDDFAAPTGIGGNPRTLRDREHTAVVILRGPSADVVEGMIDQFAVAVHRACKSRSAGRGVTYAIGRGKWTRAQHLLVDGAEWRTTLTVTFPVVDRAWAPGETPAAPTSSTRTYPEAPPDTKGTVSVAATIKGTAQGEQTIDVESP